jgi:hypothetical protein
MYSRLTGSRGIPVHGEIAQRNFVAALVEENETPIDWDDPAGLCEMKIPDRSFSWKETPVKLLGHEMGQELRSSGAEIALKMVAVTDRQLALPEGAEISGNQGAMHSRMRLCRRMDMGAWEAWMHGSSMSIRNCPLRLERETSRGQLQEGQSSVLFD